jgi:small-conductance mechanosensitive channel
VKMSRLPVTALILLLLSGAIYSIEKKKYDAAILPFANGVSVTEVFLSTLIQEKVYDELQNTPHLILLSLDESASLVPEKGKRIRYYRQKDYLKKIAVNKNVDLLITGRFILFQKYLTIETYVYNRSDDTLTKGSTFSALADGSLVDTVERYAGIKYQWMKSSLLTSDYSEHGREGFFLSEIYDSLKKSPGGALFTSRWVFLLVITIVTYILSLFIGVMFRVILLRIMRRKSDEIDIRLLSIIQKSVKWLIFTIGVKGGISFLPVKNSIKVLAGNIASSIIIIIVSFLIIKIIRILIHQWGSSLTGKIDSRIYDDLVPLFGRFSGIIIGTVGLLMVLALFEIDIAPLLASLGIAGFAIGFAVKDILSNVIGGVVLILDNAFAVGDLVTVDGTTGIIDEVGLRNTRLKTFDNEVIIIPNGELMNKQYKNSVLPDPALRLVLPFSVGYGSDIGKVKQIAMDVMEELQGISEEPAPLVTFSAMGESSLQFELKFWVPHYIDGYGKRLEALEKLYHLLEKNNIEIPFPTQTIRLHNSP